MYYFWRAQFSYLVNSRNKLSLHFLTFLRIKWLTSVTGIWLDTCFIGIWETNTMYSHSCLLISDWLMEDLICTLKRVCFIHIKKLQKFQNSLTLLPLLSSLVIIIYLSLWFLTSFLFFFCLNFFFLKITIIKQTLSNWCIYDWPA